MSMLDKAKGYAEKATDAAARATAAGKDKLDETRAKKKVHDLYADIGRLVVAQRRGGSDPEVEIAGKVAQISALEHDLGVTSDSPTAPSPDASTATPEAGA
jgi:hypothetical protein